MLTIGTLHLPSLSLAVFSWSSLYLVLRQLEPQRKAEWHCRIVTVVHASLITLITGWAAFIQGPWPFTDAGGPSSPVQVVATTICLGYFLFDFAWCLYFQTEGFPMLLHHSLSIFGMCFMLCAGKYGTEMMATICGSEVTNPLLQLRWFLKETGRYNTVMGEVVDFLFMTSFFFIRLVVGSVLLYSYFLQPTDMWGRMAAVGIYLIGWMFFVSIFQYAVYKYKKKYRAWKQARQAGSSSQSKPLLDGKKDQDSHNEDSSSRSVKDGCRSSDRQTSLGVSQNGVHHRNNGGIAVSKEDCVSNGRSSDKVPARSSLARTAHESDAD